MAVPVFQLDDVDFHWGKHFLQSLNFFAPKHHVRLYTVGLATLKRYATLDADAFINNGDAPNALMWSAHVGTNDAAYAHFCEVFHRLEQELTCPTVLASPRS